MKRLAYSLCVCIWINKHINTITHSTPLTPLCFSYTHNQCHTPTPKQSPPPPHPPTHPPTQPPPPPQNNNNNNNNNNHTAALPALQALAQRLVDGHRLMPDWRLSWLCLAWLPAALLGVETLRLYCLM